MTLEETNEAVSDHLDKIKSYFKPGVKITVLVRTVTDPDGKRDFMMGDDDPQEAMNMIARRMAYAQSPAVQPPIENTGASQSFSDEKSVIPETGFNG